MKDPENITHETALEIFRSAFMRRVGVGAGRMSYGDLSDNIGVQVRTLKSWRDGQAMPHLDSYLKLCMMFGPDFTSETLRVIGQGGVENIEQPDRFCAITTCADLVNVTQAITERLRDGVFDHRDKAETAPMLLELAHTLEEQAKAMLSELPR